MRRLLLLAALGAGGYALAQHPDTRAFEDSADHWAKAHRTTPYLRYEASQYRAIADNIVAYQNPDGGWPKNLDMTARLRPDSVRATVDAKHLRSTLDNRNVYPQVEYLSEVYALTGDDRYREAARRGMEYMLDAQHANGGWRGWDADAVTFNDGIVYGVLSTWLEVLDGKACYAWVDGDLRERIEASWRRGLDLVVDTQWVRDGVATVWAQQYDHETLKPVKARSYELPGLAAAESADIAVLLMRIDYPPQKVIDAVHAAARWFERTQIRGKRLETVECPGGVDGDPSVRRDRRLVDDPDAGPLWARYYGLEDDLPFMVTREGVKVRDLSELPAERRTGYTWYGRWGEKVLDKYAQWCERMEAQSALRCFHDGIRHWNMEVRERFAPYDRYKPTQMNRIADRMVAWQNGDGGWMKNIDYLARVEIDSVRAWLPDYRQRSTLDNRNVYPQIEYLSRAYVRYGKEAYAESVRRAIGYILATQHANGGWRGADVDAVTFNDDVMTGVLRVWQQIVARKPCYEWIEEPLRRRVEKSWRRGIDVILRCQWVRDGVKTAWGQQHDNETLLPTQARSYELPGLTGQESAGVVLLLMDIENPSREVIEAVDAAVRWFRESRIDGIRLRRFAVPEGEREDPSVAVDRKVVRDSAALPLWARYYELSDNRPFFCRRDGRKVYSFGEIDHERRVGYAWYGPWGLPVLERYEAWCRRIGRPVR